MARASRRVGGSLPRRPESRGACGAERGLWPGAEPTSRTLARQPARPSRGRQRFAAARAVVFAPPRPLGRRASAPHVRRWRGSRCSGVGHAVRTHRCACSTARRPSFPFPPTTAGVRSTSRFDSRPPSTAIPVCPSGGRRSAAGRLFVPAAWRDAGIAPRRDCHRQRAPWAERNGARPNTTKRPGSTGPPLFGESR
jgi:hypothetical protein